MKLFKTNSRPNESEKIQFQNRSRKATDFSASNHQGGPQCNDGQHWERTKSLAAYLSRIGVIWNLKQYCIPDFHPHPSRGYKRWHVQMMAPATGRYFEVWVIQRNQPHIGLSVSFYEATLTRPQIRLHLAILPNIPPAGVKVHGVGISKISICQHRHHFLVPTDR